MNATHGASANPYSRFFSTFTPYHGILSIRMGAMAQPESKPANDELRHVARFRIALRHFERRTTSVLVECRLTPQRYLLLLVIEAQAMDGEATVARLAHDLEMPRTTVAISSLGQPVQDCCNAVKRNATRARPASR